MSDKSENGFYPSVLEEMEKRLLRRAREVEGLDEEIALLRVKLAEALAQEPRNTELLLKGVTVLIRATAARMRKLPKAEKDIGNDVMDAIMKLRRSFFNDKDRRLED